MRSTTTRATHVQVEERIYEAIRITHTHNGRPLGCHAITVRPGKAVEVKLAHHFRRPVTPRPDHTWRKRWRPAREQRTASAIR